MKIIYVSTLCTKNLIDRIIKLSNVKPMQSIQKYHRLLCSGLIENNIDVETLTAIPVTSKGMKKKFWFEKKEEKDKIVYNYIPFINITLIRQLFLFVNSFILSFYKGIINKKCVFVCDVLNVSISFPTLIACKITKRKCIGIITDLPNYYGKNRLLTNLLCKFDGYVFLTKKMNEKFNPDKKPYIIIEGISEFKSIKKRDSYDKTPFFTILYAGGLYEKYGIKILIDAICDLNEKFILELYGSGDLENYIQKIKNNRIIFHGVVENSTIVEKEQEVELLINPRFSNEEYTEYSFPSKIMEYLSSGTPVLTTKLTGIPEEYDKYLYYIKSETKEGLKEEIRKLETMDRKKIFEKSLEGQKYVLNNKNKQIQAKKLIEMIYEIN